jgi:hypothetical protein
MMAGKEYVVGQDELDKMREDASVSHAIKELASILTGRADDVPHRFRAPGKFANYFTEYVDSNSSMYHQLPLTYSTQINPLMLQVTTRPQQKILELIFQDANGQRLFTLEIEYDE